MRRLHAYLLRRFLVDFGICMLSVLALYVVLDLSANLGKFLKPGRSNPAGFIAEYYAYRLPLLFAKLAPLAALLGAAFSLTLLESRNELTAVKAAGISMVRFTRPILLAGAALAGLCLAFEEWVVPWASGQVYVRNLERSDAHRWSQTVPDPNRSQYIFYLAYFPAEKRMEKIHVTRVDSRMREREAVVAEEAVFHSRNGGFWLMKNGYSQRYDELGYRSGPPERFSERVLDTGLRPTDMENHSRPDEMPLSAVYQAWRANPSERTLGLQFHSRAALPFATLLLLLVGMPVALAGAHRRFFLGALATGLIAGAYFILLFTAQQLGMAGQLPPVVAGWGANALFAALAAAVYDLGPS